MTLLLSLIKLIDMLFWLDKAKNDTYLVFFFGLGNALGPVNHGVLHIESVLSSTTAVSVHIM